MFVFSCSIVDFTAGVTVSRWASLTSSLPSLRPAPVERLESSLLSAPQKMVQARAQALTVLPTSYPPPPVARIGLP